MLSSTSPHRSSPVGASRRSCTPPPSCASPAPSPASGASPSASPAMTADMRRRRTLASQSGHMKEGKRLITSAGEEPEGSDLPELIPLDTPAPAAPLPAVPVDTSGDKDDPSVAMPPMAFHTPHKRLAAATADTSNRRKGASSPQLPTAVSAAASSSAAASAATPSRSRSNISPSPSSASSSPAAAAVSGSLAASSAAAAASPLLSACSLCTYRFPPGANHSHRSLHLRTCQPRTPDERVIWLKNRMRDLSDAERKKRNEEAAAAPTPRKAASPSDTKRAKSKSPDSQRKRQHKDSERTPRGRKGPVSSSKNGPIQSERLLKAVGYNLAAAEDAAAARNKKVWEVEAVRSRRFNRRTLQYEYELKWLGWPESDNTWEPAMDTHCRDLIHQYHLRDEEELTRILDEQVEQSHRDPPAVAFHRDGFCSLTDAALTLSRAEVSDTLDKVTNLFNSTMKTIVNRDELELLEKRGYQEFKMRDRGRYDLTLKADDYPFLANPPWLAAVRSILGGTAKLQHAGCMMSLPTSATQKFHSDGPHRSKDTHLPAYMANVFVPLVDMTRSLGGTQFAPGSHVHHDFNIRTTLVTPLLQAGQCLIFDYRIRHRGLENRDTKARPVLYFTYSASDDIVDEDNFKKGRYAPLPPLSVALSESRGDRLKKRRRQRGEAEESSSESDSSGEEEDNESAAEGASSEEDTPDVNQQQDESAPAAAVGLADAEEAESKSAPARRRRGKPAAGHATAAAAAIAAPSTAAASAVSASASANMPSSPLRPVGEHKSQVNPAHLVDLTLDTDASDGGSSDEEVESPAAASSSMREEKKRGRGRPRKQAKHEETKRGRGRPRRSPAHAAAMELD